MTPAFTAHYVYDLNGRLIAEANSAGQTTREYVWIDDLPLAVVADVDTMSPQLWFVHADHLDRPIKMTNGAQAIVWDAVYRPFGEPVSITGVASNNLRFPGQYFLIESGLHYNWHRQYDPTTGRYLQPDLLGFVDGPSVYAYVNSAPTQFVDPEGKLAWWVLPAIFVGADLGWQLYQNNGNWSCVDPWRVIGAGFAGLPIAPKGVGGVITGYTRHGLNQAISRDGVGVSAKAILDAVRNPSNVVQEARGATRYVGRDATVIVNSEGRVITTWSRNSGGVRNYFGGTP